jgi:type IV pilus assembly protein PilA
MSNRGKKIMENNQKGFSLVELLVVVTIVGIIAALAVPFYRRAIIGTENGATFAMIKIMLQEQTNFYSQKGRYARLDELNSQYGGNFGVTTGNTIVRSKFTFSMSGTSTPPTDAELKDSFTVVATRTIDSVQNPYVIQVSPTGEIEQVLP